MRVPDEFHPEFYVTVATVLPLLLLVTNLVKVYLNRWPRDSANEVWLFAPTPTSLWFRITVAASMACINVATEVTCLIVLFIRRSGPVTSLIIWVGLGCSLWWTLVLLSAYINVPQRPSQGE